MRIRPRAFIAGALATVAAVGGGWLTFAQGDTPHRALGDDGPNTVTPIKHVVVIFDENESFDHYFGTYPNAANNNASEVGFGALPGTPTDINNYVLHPELLTQNPNSSQPHRFTRAQALGCTNSHDYSAEQRAFDGGAMDKFPENTGAGCGGSTMNYFDGNTVTALWNYAEHYTMSDEFFGSTFGPSTPGALNLIAGNTNGATSNDADGTGTITGDPDPIDDCGNHANTDIVGHQNIGDLLSAAATPVTWGWFQGGFARTAVSGVTATCGSGHKNIGGAAVGDYSAHHEPFQYFASTRNEHHVPPTSVADIGTNADAATHQYDLTDFDAALAAGNMPQVSFLKGAAYEDGHPGYSDPVDEQQFIVHEVNEIQASPEWDSTAIIIAYDDSDGWYDHVFAGNAALNSSNTPSDSLNGSGTCGTGESQPALGGQQDRCGPGPRLPFLIISPWVKPNTVHHTPREQASIIRFIEDNWLGGQRLGNGSFDARAATLDSMFDFTAGDPRAGKLTLDPATGQGPDTGTNVTVTATPTPSATSTPTPTPSPTPSPGTGTFKPKASCKANRKHGKVTLACKVKGITTAGSIKLKASLLRGKKTVATGKGTVKRGKVTIKLKAAKHAKLTKGRYTLKVTVTQGKHAKKLSAKIKLK